MGQSISVLSLARPKFKFKFLWQQPQTQRSTLQNQPHAPVYFLDIKHSNKFAGMDHEEDFGSVAWETPTPSGEPLSSSHHEDVATELADASPSVVAATTSEAPDPLSWGKTALQVEVRDAVVELEGTKDMFVSYLVTAKVSLLSLKRP